MIYVVYNINTGEINKQLSCSSDIIQMNCSDNEDWIEHTGNDSTHYVNVINKEVVPKETMLLNIDKYEVVADGNEIVTITNIPSDIKLSIIDPVNDTTTVDIVDDILTMDFDYTGEYFLTFKNFKYLDYQVKIICT